MVTEIELFESGIRFLLCGWMKSEVYTRKVDTAVELLARIVDAAACIKKSDDQLRRTTRHLRTPVAKFTEICGAICENLL